MLPEELFTGQCPLSARLVDEVSVVPDSYQVASRAVACTIHVGGPVLHRAVHIGEPRAACWDQVEKERINRVEIGRNRAATYSGPVPIRTVYFQG